MGKMMASKEQKERFMQVLEAAQRAGVAHPEIIAAQWAVESSWGKKQSGKNNFWGVKAGNGDPNNNSGGTVILTTENINGKDVKVRQKFRDYNSLEEALSDRAKFTLENPRYRKAGYFDATSPAEAALALQRAGYATDPNYANTLKSVLKSAGIDPHNGTRFDYSTTKPQPIVSTAPSQQYQRPDEWLSAFSSPTEQQNTNPFQAFTDNFNQLNGTLDAFTSQEPAVNYQKQYQKQLANAFGIEPETDGMLGSEIEKLVRSIYDETA